MVNPPSSLDPNPIVTLAEIPRLMALLADRIRQAGFLPGVIVYVESGARLPAAVLCAELAIGAVPVRAQRWGHRLKRMLAPLARLVPRSAMNAMRRAEERSGIHGRTRRRVEFAQEHDFREQNILIVDDAADSGGTLFAVRVELLNRGADAARIRTAVLAATTAAARQQTDFYVLERNSVLPWSADSDERKVAWALMRETKLPAP